MLRATPLILLLCAVGCGGGGGDAPLATLSGRLSLLPAVTARTAGRTEASTGAGTLLTARLAEREPSGVARPGELSVFRYVADAARVLTARAEGAVEACLYDLASGRCRGTLAVEAGSVYDVIVSGEGPFRVTLEAGDGSAPVTDLAPPAGYLDLDCGLADGELVAAAADGEDPAALALAIGADWIAGDGGLCLLRLRGDAETDTVAELRRVLCCCAHLEADGLARFAEPNLVRRLSQNANDPRLNEQWGLDNTRIKAAWSIATGSGSAIPVAVIDSGIRFDHPDLQGRLEPGWDFVQDDADPTDTGTQFAHGTSTASIIGASTNNGVGIAGVHWGARIIPIRAFAPNGNGTIYNISQAIRFAAGLSNDSNTVPALPARVINLSFAAGAPATAEEEACQAARDAGALLVAASGNEGSTSSFYPAAYPAVMGIGATTVDNRHPSYSNSGSWVALAAPGGDFSAGVLCAGLSGGALGYVAPNGTSFACPHVAGVAALVLSVAPLSVDDLEQLLIDTAQDLGVPGPDSQFGAGLVDAYAALSAVAQVPTLALNEPILIRVIDEATGDIAYETNTTVSQTLVWSVGGVAPGRYRILAGTDRNGDGAIDDAGEVGGVWNAGEVLEVGATAMSGLDFVLTLQ
ncbi:MAG: S8 family serine peptidase [Planctomycetota bacterium]|jgi:hypothetical protein